MSTLVGLAGVSSDSVEAIHVTSRTSALKHLRGGARAVTAAGDNGALNVWIDEDGMYRCSFHRFLSTKNHGTWKYLASVDAWLREWWPRMKVS